MKRRAFLLGVAGVAEGNEEPALAAAFAFAFHNGFELIDGEAADLVSLLDLNREPVVGEETAFRRLGADGKDAVVRAHVVARAPCWKSR